MYGYWRRENKKIYMKKKQNRNENTNSKLRNCRMNRCFVHRSYTRIYVYTTLNLSYTKWIPILSFIFVIFCSLRLLTSQISMDSIVEYVGYLSRTDSVNWDDLVDLVDLWEIKGGILFLLHWRLNGRVKWRKCFFNTQSTQNNKIIQKLIFNSNRQKQKKIKWK